MAGVLGATETGPLAHRSHERVDFAIRIVASLHVPVGFRVCGVMSDEVYWKACQHLADRELGVGMIPMVRPLFPVQGW